VLNESQESKAPFFLSSPSSGLGTHLGAKLSLARGMSPPDCRLLSKAELCTKTGSQAGAWEPEELRILGEY